jgi:ribulose-5-phosphate 4-epimerase/fuculose-1-phosphate aldolase
MQEPIAQHRAELATATRVLVQHHLIGMFGHVSVLTDDPQRYLVCPGAGARKDRCRSTDVLELHLDDEPRSSRVVRSSCICTPRCTGPSRT